MLQGGEITATAPHSNTRSTQVVIFQAFVFDHRHHKNVQLHYLYVRRTEDEKALPEQVIIKIYTNSIETLAKITNLKF